MKKLLILLMFAASFSLAEEVPKPEPPLPQITLEQRYAYMKALADVQAKEKVLEQARTVLIDAVESIKKTCGMAGIATDAKGDLQCIEKK